MIEVQKSRNSLGFRVSGDLLKQVYEWEYSQDKLVFEEQLKTGSFRDRFRVPEPVLQLMRQVESEGKIMPYYGAGGSSGACVYKFRVKGAQCHFQAWHSFIKEKLDLEVDLLEADLGKPMIRQTEMQFSFLPYVTNEELDRPWTGERNPTLVCKIDGTEYETLTQWENWRNDLALTSRYIYEFAQVSMGATGLTVKVEDTETGERLDATDYDSW